MKTLIRDIKNKLGGKRADHFLRFVYKYHYSIWKAVNPDTGDLRSDEYVIRYAKEIYHLKQTYSDFDLIKDILNSHGLGIKQFAMDYYYYKYKKLQSYETDVIDSYRDNRDSKIGSGGYNANKIRYPKQCRKTAWKRFYKLFPHLKPSTK